MSSELSRRVLVGVIAAPIAIAIVLVGGAPLAALLAIVAALGAWELFRIARASGLAPLDNVGIVIAGLIPLAVHARYLHLYDAASMAFGAVSVATLVVLFVFALTIWTRGVAGRPLSAAAVTIFGAAYVGATLSFGYAIRYHEYAFEAVPLPIAGHTFQVPSGGLLLLLPLVATWASDIGAYAIGRTLGRNKLIPSVSPGKTVEGAIGGVLATMLWAWVYTHWVLRPLTHLDFKSPPIGVLAFGLIVSVVAQIGDLAESLIKREGGVKDSSQLIPGHGGILDRLDSLFFVLPVSYVLLSAFLTYAL
ncbi:MAG TPA: CDP-archaeol synthase [Gemmatimonadaceae bacterium]|nr:CDP-archaeol synthase [Gemmatimonadaceae bacterium]